MFLLLVCRALRYEKLTLLERKEAKLAEAEKSAFCVSREQGAGGGEGKGASVNFLLQNAGMLF